ncbi:hypothetical protein Glove_535g11 [Diversispora epigaea]|uniref:VWFA domain-containing protein n=1 Tax=Diversispora epigaea TaxID=1348612 RepID=A0A397GFS6_9GLOM|nr:hypothetical protein Glove_535g11 [Diversispora epigaea]
MYLTTFTCEDAELSPGDGEDFGLCHKLCENAGRHRHIDYCINPIFCKIVSDGKMESVSEHMNDCKPLCTSTRTYGLRNSHNNRLVSLVLFEDSAKCIFENRSLTNSDELLQIMMTYHASGFTNFAAGINTASTVIQNYCDPLKTNVVIFLSDDFYKAAENEVRSLCSQERTRAKEYLPQTKDGPLTCKYVHAVDELNISRQLLRVLEDINEKLSTNNYSVYELD